MNNRLGIFAIRGKRLNGLSGIYPGLESDKVKTKRLDHLRPVLPPVKYLKPVQDMDAPIVNRDTAYRLAYFCSISGIGHQPVMQHQEIPPDLFLPGCRKVLKGVGDGRGRGVKRSFRLHKQDLPIFEPVQRIPFGTDPVKLEILLVRFQ